MASAPVDSDEDEIFWGPITVKELKASMRLDEKLKRWPVTLKENTESPDKNHAQNFFSENETHNGLTSNKDSEKSEKEFDSTTENKTTEELVSKSTSSPDISANTPNESLYDSDEHLKLMSPITTPNRTNGCAEEFSTPGLRSLSPICNESSLVSADSSFLDASESSVQEVTSDSFEKMDPNKYVSEKNKSSNSNQPTSSFQPNEKPNFSISSFAPRMCTNFDPNDSEIDEFLRNEKLCKLDSSAMYEDSFECERFCNDATSSIPLENKASSPLSEQAPVDSKYGNLINVKEAPILFHESSDSCNSHPVKLDQSNDSEKLQSTKTKPIIKKATLNLEKTSYCKKEGKESPESSRDNIDCEYINLKTESIPEQLINHDKNFAELKEIEEVTPSLEKALHCKRESEESNPVSTESNRNHEGINLKSESIPEQVINLNNSFTKPNEVKEVPLNFEKTSYCKKEDKGSSPVSSRDNINHEDINLKTELMTEQVINGENNFTKPNEVEEIPPNFEKTSYCKREDKGSSPLSSRDNINREDINLKTELMTKQVINGENNFTKPNEVEEIPLNLEKTSYCKKEDKGSSPLSSRDNINREDINLKTELMTEQVINGENYFTKPNEVEEIPPNFEKPSHCKRESEESNSVFTGSNTNHEGINSKSDLMTKLINYDSNFGTPNEIKKVTPNLESTSFCKKENEESNPISFCNNINCEDISLKQESMNEQITDHGSRSVEVNETSDSETIPCSKNSSDEEIKSTNENNSSVQLVELDAEENENKFNCSAELKHNVVNPETTSVITNFNPAPFADGQIENATLEGDSVITAKMQQKEDSAKPKSSVQGAPKKITYFPTVKQTSNQKITYFDAKTIPAFFPNDSNPKEINLVSGDAINQSVKKTVPEANVISGSDAQYSTAQNEKISGVLTNIGSLTSPCRTSTKEMSPKLDNIMLQSEDILLTSSKLSDPRNQDVASFKNSTSAPALISNSNESNSILKNMNASILNETEIMCESPPSFFANSTMVVNQSRLSERKSTTISVQIKEPMKVNVPKTTLNSPKRSIRTPSSNINKNPTPKTSSSKKFFHDKLSNNANSENSKRIVPPKIRTPTEESTSSLDRPKSTSLNLKFDRLSPSSAKSSTLTPGIDANSLKMKPLSKGRTLSDKKDKFFSPCQTSITHQSASAKKTSSFIKPPKFIAPKFNPEQVVNNEPQIKPIPNLNQSSLIAKPFQGQTTSNLTTPGKKSVTSIPKPSLKMLNKIPMKANQENISNSIGSSEKPNLKFKNVSSPVAAYINNHSSPLSNTSLNSSSDSNRSCKSKIPQQKYAFTNSNSKPQSRLPRIDNSKIPKIPVLSKVCKTSDQV